MFSGYTYSNNRTLTYFLNYVGNITSNFIEEPYYGNIEPQKLNSEPSGKLSRKMNALTEKEEKLTAKPTDEDNELFIDYVNTYNEF